MSYQKLRVVLGCRWNARQVDSRTYYGTVYCHYGLNSDHRHCCDRELNEIVYKES